MTSHLECKWLHGRLFLRTDLAFVKKGCCFFKNSKHHTALKKKKKIWLQKTITMMYWIDFHVINQLHTAYEYLKNVLKQLKYIKSQKCSRLYFGPSKGFVCSYIVTLLFPENLNFLAGFAENLKIAKNHYKNRVSQTNDLRIMWIYLCLQ